MWKACQLCGSTSSGAGQTVVDKMFVFSPKRQARIAGALYLVVILAGMFTEVFVRPKILMAGDAAVTAHNLAAHLPLYRVGLLTDLLTVVAAVAEGVIVYRLFKPLSPTLALMSLLIALVSNAGGWSAAFSTFCLW